MKKHASQNSSHKTSSFNSLLQTTVGQILRKEILAYYSTVTRRLHRPVGFISKFSFSLSDFNTLTGSWEIILNVEFKGIFSTIWLF